MQINAINAINFSARVDDSFRDKAERFIKGAYNTYSDQKAMKRHEKPTNKSEEEEEYIQEQMDRFERQVKKCEDYGTDKMVLKYKNRKTPDGQEQHILYIEEPGEPIIIYAKTKRFGQLLTRFFEIEHKQEYPQDMLTYTANVKRGHRRYLASELLIEYLTEKYLSQEQSDNKLAQHIKDLEKKYKGKEDAYFNSQAFDIYKELYPLVCESVENEKTSQQDRTETPYEQLPQSVRKRHNDRLNKLLEETRRLDPVLEYVTRGKFETLKEAKDAPPRKHMSLVEIEALKIINAALKKDNKKKQNNDAAAAQDQQASARKAVYQCLAGMDSCNN